MKRKDFGQHFLVDKQVIYDEIRFASLNSSDIVLEVGPGKGALTYPLAQTASMVIAIEKDKKLIDSLKSTMPENVLLIHADAILYDFSSLPIFTKIVSNLPFKISSSITFKFFQYHFEKAILMYQREFAKRMIATPGSKEYSRLSVGVYYHAHCRILRSVSKHAFDPRPLVDSCLIELIPRKTPPFYVNDEEFFFNVVANCFNHRRKKIKTILKTCYKINPSGLSFLDERVEDLTPEQIGILSDEIIQMTQKRE
jgi:16S rRNA (adenine1518-N6/adenine1519-N6)-dimethyltransferase